MDAADLWTLAEVLDLPEDELDSAVESTLRNLRVEPTHVGTACIEVHWKTEGRPIQISSVTGAKASEPIAETLEERLPLATVPGLVRVREHLSRCRQVVNFEAEFRPASRGVDLNPEFEVPVERPVTACRRRPRATSILP